MSETKKPSTVHETPRSSDAGKTRPIPELTANQKRYMEGISTSNAFTFPKMLEAYNGASKKQK